MPQPYNVFTIYAREDARLLSELLSHLKPLENNGRIKVWSDREINPGVRWEEEIVSHLDTADIILILVSPAYYNSEYIHREEIKRAMERHQRGEAKVLPIIVRPCAFEDDPVVNSLQVLPTDGKAVTDDEHWRSQDKAWLDVINGLKRTLAALLAAENRREQDAERAENERLAAEKHIRDQQARLERKASESERKAALKRQLAAPESQIRNRYVAIGVVALLLIAVLSLWQPWKGKPNSTPTISEQQEKKLPPVLADQEAFGQAERTGTVSAWQQFIDKFPASTRRQKADKQLADLKNKVAALLKEANTFIKLDEPGRAKPLLNEALQLDPDSKEAKAILNTLK